MPAAGDAVDQNTFPWGLDKTDRDTQVSKHDNNLNRGHLVMEYRTESRLEFPKQTGITAENERANTYPVQDIIRVDVSVLILGQVLSTLDIEQSIRCRYQQIW